MLGSPLVFGWLRNRTRASLKAGLLALCVLSCGSPTMFDADVSLESANADTPPQLEGVSMAPGVLPVAGRIVEVWVSTDPLEPVDVPDTAGVPAEVDSRLADTAEDAAADIPPEPDVQPAAPMVALGQVDADGQFSVLLEGQPLEIVQGPQGGIHAEVVVEVLPLSDEGAKFVVGLNCSTHIDDALVGLIDVKNYKLIPVGDDGWYRSQLVPIFFEKNVAAPYEGHSATISCEIKIAGVVFSAVQTVLLIDDV